MLEDVIAWDREAFLYLNALGTSSWDAFWLFMTDSKTAIPLYIVLLFFTYRLWGLRGTLIVLISMALMITCTDQLSNFFKYGIQRLRPCHDTELATIMRLVKSHCGGKYAYFSAHAANSFAVASFFWFFLRKDYVLLGVFLLFWASIVAYSRIYIGVHFPLDILTGMFVGILFGWLFYKLSIFARQKFRV